MFTGFDEAGSRWIWLCALVDRRLEGEEGLTCGAGGGGALVAATVIDTPLQYLEFVVDDL